MAIEEKNAPKKEEPLVKEETVLRPLMGRETEELKIRIASLRSLISGATSPEESMTYAREIIKIEEELKIRHFETPSPKTI